MTRASSVDAETPCMAWWGPWGAPQVTGKVGIKGDGFGGGRERDSRFTCLQIHPCTWARTDLLREENGGCCLQGLLVKCQTRLTGRIGRGVRVCSWCQAHSWPGGWMPPPWFQPALFQSSSRRRMKPLPIFRGSPRGLQISRPPPPTTRRYHLEELSLDVGFVLWKSSLGKREGEARGQALRAPSTS